MRLSIIFGLGRAFIMIWDGSRRGGVDGVCSRGIWTGVLVVGYPVDKVSLEGVGLGYAVNVLWAAQDGWVKNRAYLTVRCGSRVSVGIGSKDTIDKQRLG